MAFIMGVLNCTFFISLRNVLGWAYSNDAAVVEIVSNVLPLTAVFQISDGLCAIGSGILRGSGKQEHGAYVNLFGYYVIGLPLGIYLGLRTSLALAGVWIGLAIALFVNSIVIATIAARTNWPDEARKARLLVGGDDDADGRDEERRNLLDGSSQEQ
eukprot:jgi/Hompol1/7026/HPOL_000291-RA